MFYKISTRFYTQECEVGCFYFNLHLTELFFLSESIIILQFCVIVIKTTLLGSGKVSESLELCRRNSDIKHISMVIKKKLPRFLIIAISSIVILVLYRQVHLIVTPFHLQKTLASFVMHLTVCLPIVVVLFLLHKPKDFFHQLGLDGNIITGIVFALISTLLLFIAFPIIGEFNKELTLDKLIRSTVIVALFEEIIFRGFIFGQLFCYCKISFGWSVLIPSVLFGSLHLYQGHDLISSLMAFGVTFLGGLYFSWIYVKWNFNLWCPIGLHFFMNLSWQLFIVEGNSVAAGSIISNIFRILSVALAVIITNLSR